MGNVLEARGGADHGFVDLAAGSGLLLLGGGRAGLGLCILGAIVDLFEEIVCLAFVSERKADETLVAFERVEEGAVLVVLKTLIELMLPDDASGAFEVDYLEVKGCFDEVTYKGDGAFDAGIAP